MLRDAEVDPDPVLRKLIQHQTRIGNSFVRTIHRDTAGTGADPQVPTTHVLFLVKLTDPSRNLPHVADVNLLDIRPHPEQVSPHLLKPVSNGRGQSDSCNYDSVGAHF
ncbi:MAG: hypothetical protein BWY82_01297 [Verrucomicrobia bacterium ADurb.Bin474]|nr:MAG: hypothetical protein BWY82_01297 [Verrucomicrobia bacterium ADurb.Bin474]